MTIPNIVDQQPNPDNVLHASDLSDPRPGQEERRRVIETLLFADAVPPAGQLEQLAARLAGLPLGQPNAWRDAISAALPLGCLVVVTGPMERRLLGIATTDGWVMADLSGRPHRSRDWPAWAVQGVTLAEPDGWLSHAVLTESAVERFLRPRVLVAALYRPEFFPLPRFSLAISDLARAARLGLSGTVDLIDMQLGASLADITRRISSSDEPPDIVGISATFGQHDLLTTLLDQVFAMPRPPLVLAGGSLTARNERSLLERYPRLLIARAAGEPTIADAIRHWHGDLPVDAIRGIAYAAPTSPPPAMSTTSTTGTPVVLQRNAGQANRTSGDFLPELDLLQATFTAGGVAQLESSRGCTSACSFCPRGHKGGWAGGTHLDQTADAFTQLLTHLRAEFDHHPDLARVLYLVDEEFIGAQPDAAIRARALATRLSDAGFTWETSCRIDQIADPDLDRDWHLERAQLWRDLLTHGLRRCLFGIESGVTSILERFNKGTTGDQNATGIRLLSALGVPTRFTYITFDHLMDLDELRDTHTFLGRTDLLLRPLPDLPLERIVDGVHDADFIAAHATGRPFYTAVSYPLVSMECLIGAAYTRRVQHAGLAGRERPTMGRIDARFADPRIGVCSDLAQRWVDRNFALDYTLKSVEKTLEDPPRNAVRATREVLRTSAHGLLTDMITAAERFDVDEPPQEHLRNQLVERMDELHAKLRVALTSVLDETLPELPTSAARSLSTQHARWAAARDWTLINPEAASV